MTTDKELRDAIAAKARDNRIDCKTLLDLAAERSVSPAELGRLCNEMHIRIGHCQLGCFT